MKAILLSSITLILSATITGAVVIPRDSLVSRQSSPSLESINRRRVSGSIALRDISEGIVQLQPRANKIKDENDDKTDRKSPSPAPVLADTSTPVFQKGHAVNGEADRNLADVYRSPSPSEVLPGIRAFPKDIHPSRLGSYKEALDNPTSSTSPTVTRALAKAIREEGLKMPPGLTDSNSGQHRT